MTPPSEAAVWESLRQVEDPELGVDIVNLGLVYEIRIGPEAVAVEMTLTSLGCPVAPELEAAVKALVGALPGVSRVDVEWSFDPPWTSARITEDGRDQLIALGLL